MAHRIGLAVRRAVTGVRAAIRFRPVVFAAVTLAVFALHLTLPVAVLSLARKPWDHWSFNPWLSRLPAYLASSEIPLGGKLEFLPNLALFWFSANGPHGSVEWGFTVDVTDVARFIVMSLLIGVYFALVSYRRGQLTGCAWRHRGGRPGGVAGALASVLGLSTGPCSVMGCGAPILPVAGLVFAGLSSGTLKLLSGLSRALAPAVALVLIVGVAYLGWLVGGNLMERAAPVDSAGRRGAV